MRSRFPRATPAQVRGEIGLERSRREVVETVLGEAAGAGRGRFGSLARLIGCPEPGREVRAGISIHFIDETTGLSKNYYMEVGRAGTGTIREQVKRLAGMVIEDARSHGYKIVRDFFDDLSEDRNYVDFHFFDCPPPE